MLKILSMKVYKALLKDFTDMENEMFKYKLMYEEESKQREYLEYEMDTLRGVRYR